MLVWLTMSIDESSGTSNFKGNARHYLSYAGLLLLVITGFVYTYQFVEPSPPRVIKLAAGSKHGAYYRYAQVYAELLQKEGIAVDVIESSGSVENIGLLDGSPGLSADVAFVQGGITSTQQGLTSLGSLYFEPVWIFHKKSLKVSSLHGLQGKRIAVGADGSGTQALAKLLLGRNGLNEQNAFFVKLPGKQAVNALQAGKVDMLFMVAAHQSPLVQKLLADQKVSLMNVQRAEAYSRIFPYLSVISLPQGVIDFDENIPGVNVRMLATTANLVAHPDLHPALVSLLLQAAEKIHGRHGLFNRVGEFPTSEYISFPLNEESAHYYKHGPSFLQRFLPFWAANLVDRLKIMLLPLVALLIPFFKLMPPVYRWRVRRRIYRWYSELRMVDPALNEVTAENLERFNKELDRIEEEVRQVEVPLSYADELYNLRLHLEMVRRKLN